MTDPNLNSSTARSGHIIEGRYLLSSELGRGSTGVVWAGQDLVADEPIAVKILHAALLGSPAAVGRFRREMVSAGALDHPHSVTVKAHGQTADGSEYLVMERLSGRTLQALFAESGPLPQTRAIQIIAQILDAVGAAHRGNIIHRDLKPGNVILIESGREHDFAKVCDFGLAKTFNSDGTEDGDHDAQRIFASMSTGQGDLCGTPEYMAPEQARGETLDGRADLYSVAVMLFQAVVGRLPFQGKTPLAVLSLHLSALPPRPGALRPDLGIAPALENLILRGLAKDRSERPSSAEVFRADLLQIERDLLREGRQNARRHRTSAESATLPTPPSAGLTNGPKKTILGAAAMIFGASIVLGGLWTASSTPRNPATSPPVVAPTTPAPDAISTVPALVGGIGIPDGPRSSSPRLAKTSVGKDRRQPVAARPSASIVAAISQSQAAAGTPTAAPPALPVAEVHSPEAGFIAAEETIQRAEDLLAEGQGLKACALGETAAARNPQLALAHGFLGRCYMRLGQPDKGRASYRKYLELAPADDDARFVRAIVERKRQ